MRIKQNINNNWLFTKDNVTLEEVEKALNIKTVKTDSLGCAFISAIINENR